MNDDGIRGRVVRIHDLDVYTWRDTLQRREDTVVRFTWDNRRRFGRERTRKTSHRGREIVGFDIDGVGRNEERSREFS